MIALLANKQDDELGSDSSSVSMAINESISRSDILPEIYDNE